MGVEELVDTPLHEAVRYSDIDAVTRALVDGYDPNQLGAYQWSPLHEACNNGDEDIVKLLLKYKGDPSVQDTLRGCTALHYAASQENTECLRLLLLVESLCHVRNADGESALDVAVGECRKLLQAERDKNIVYNQPEPEVIRQNLLYDTLASISSGSYPSPRSDLDQSLCASGSQEVIRIDSELGDLDSLKDLDEISVDSGTTTSSHTKSKKWGTDGVVGLNRNQALGHIQLSFEYNSKKSTLKIRVWQVLDLLMPPPETSMIHSIYVKSYLLPDKRKVTKRKSEEIKLENKIETDNKKSVESGSTIFRPSSFVFSKSMDYGNVSSSIISTRDVFLSVCITQKYSHKSFTIATWSIPLQNAIKKLVKEKYTLKPCISTSIPDNMKIYNATELGIVRTKAFGSNPSLLCRRTTIDKWAVPYPERSASDSDLNRVTVDKLGNKVPSIEITVPEAENEELQEALQQIAIMEHREATSGEHSASTTVNLDHYLDSSRYSLPGTSHSADKDLCLDEVRVESNVQLAHVEVHMPNVDSAVNQVDNPLSIPSRKMRRSHLEAKSMNTGWVETIVTPPKKIDNEFTQSRPATPSWDYYAEPLELTAIPVDFDDGDEGSSSPRLPMAMTLDLPQVHNIQKVNPHNLSETSVDLPQLSSLSGYHQHRDNAP